MEFNALKKKYLPDAGNEPPEQPVSTVPEEETTVVFAEPGLPAFDTDTDTDTYTDTYTDTVPEVVGTVKESVPAVVASEPVSEEEDGGFFGREIVTSRGRERRRNRNGWPIRIPLDRLSSLPWLDIIMILLTVIGVVWVIVNFDAITTIIAAAIGKLIQSLIGLVLVVAVIVGLVLLTRRGRRFF